MYLSTKIYISAKECAFEKQNIYSNVHLISKKYITATEFVLQQQNNIYFTPKVYIPAAECAFELQNIYSSNKTCISTAEFIF